MTVEIRALRPEDDRRAFASGDADLDRFLERYAGQNQFRYHVGVTYVVCEASRVCGFLTVSAASLDAEELPGSRAMPPYPLPVLRVARLAVDAKHRGQGLGGALLRFAFELAEKMRDELGCVGVVVDAKPAAVEFYRSFGFVAVEAVQGGSPERPAPMPMFLPVASIPRRPSR